MHLIRFLLLSVIALAAVRAADNPLSTAMAGAGQPWEYGDVVFLINDAWDAPGSWNYCWRIRDALVASRPELDLRVEVNGIGDPRALLEYAATSAIPREPALVVICTGNAIAAAVPPAGKPDTAPTAEQMGKYLGDTLAKLKEAKIDVIVLGPSPVSDNPAAKTPQDERSAAYAEAVASVAKAADVCYIDMRAACLDLLKSDPPAAGKTVISAGESKYANPWHQLAASLVAKAIGERMALAPMKIDVSDSPFIDSLTVDLPVKRARTGADLEIRYTLDGKEPGKTAKKYDKPFQVTANATLNVIATDKTNNLTASAKAVFTKTKGKAGEALSKRALGLEWGLFAGRWQGLPDFTSLKPETTGTWYAPEANPHRFSPGFGNLRENIGARFVGYIDIPVEGVYQFGTVSDDGSRMWIDDEMVVDNDGLHGMRLRTGRVALREGLHRVRIDWFNSVSGSGLEVWWQSDTIRRAKVPDSAWYRNPAKPHDWKVAEKPADKPADKKK